jgi:hypothetical protein
MSNVNKPGDGEGERNAIVQDGSMYICWVEHTGRVRVMYKYKEKAGVQERGREDKRAA